MLSSITLKSHFDVSSAANTKLLKLCNNAANIQNMRGVLFYFTSIEILSDLRLEKCGPLAGHINLTYDQTRFSME